VLLSVLRLPFRLPSPPNAASRLALFLSVLGLPFPSPSSFSCMPDIVPSTSTAQPTTASSINAQFLSAVTRGDEHYARSLLARGADVNATDAVGRSTVACVVAGERYAERAGCSRDYVGRWLNAAPPQLADRRSFIYDYEPPEHPPATCRRPPRIALHA
jgi:hypothetical protein